MGLWMAAWAARECADESGTHACTNTHTLHYAICNDFVTHIMQIPPMCLLSVHFGSRQSWQTADTQMDVSGCWPS